MMAPEELLRRVGGTLRSQVAPATTGTLAQAQAFMAAVIVNKLAKQLSLASSQAEIDRRDRASLVADLERTLTQQTVPDSIRTALAGLQQRDGNASLCEFIAALHLNRDDLGGLFDELLDRVRTTMRAQIDRRLEYAA